MIGWLTNDIIQRGYNHQPDMDGNVFMKWWVSESTFRYHYTGQMWSWVYQQEWQSSQSNQWHNHHYHQSGSLSMVTGYSRHQILHVAACVVARGSLAGVNGWVGHGIFLHGFDGAHEESRFFILISGEGVSASCARARDPAPLSFLRKPCESLS